MQLKHVKLVGLVSGVLLIAVIVLSLFHPWWQLRIGDWGSANFSMVKTDFAFLGLTFLIPLLTAINVSCLLFLSISAAFMLAFSLNPTRRYAKPLLDWAYKKPLVILISFIAGIAALVLLVPGLVKQFAHVDLILPILGTTSIQVPSELLGGLSGAQISIAVSGAFHWTFYLAIAAAVLCIATRVMYRKAAFIANPVVEASVSSS